MGDAKQTWYQHGLTAHDEDNLHWSELWHFELTALVDGMTQLVRKDATEEPDGGGLCNVRVLVDSYVGAGELKIQCLPDVEDNEGGPVPSSDESYNSGCTHDDIALEGCSGDANDPGLHAERDHDEAHDNDREDVRSHGSGQVSLGNVTELSS
jgi:hypothetical protein